MRRAAPAVGLVALVAGIVGCGLIRWPISAALVGTALNRAHGGSGDLRWARPEAATFRALPWPSISIYGARLDAFGLRLMSAPEARLELSIGDLLEGRIVATRTALTRPIVTIDLESPAFAGEDRLSRALHARLAIAPLSNVALTNGVVRLIDSKHAFDTVFDDVQGRLEGLELGASLRANLSAIWRETPVAVAGSLGGLDPAAGKEPAELNIGIASPVGKLALTGNLAAGPTPSLTGQLSFSSPAIVALAHLAGLNPQFQLADDNFSFNSKLRSGREDLTLDDATIVVGGQALEGAFRIANYRGRVVASGTLDAERLSANALFGSPSPWTDSDGAWTDHPFVTTLPTTLDVDLRLSAGTVDIYGHTLENAAASLLLKGNELTATLIEAAVYAGKIEGEARVRRQHGNLDLHARAKLSEIDLGAALADFGVAGFSGLGDAAIALATSGASPRAAIAQVSGTASLQAQGGAIANFNLEEGLRRSQRQSPDVAHGLRSGQTAFDQIELEALVGDGVAHIAKGTLTAQGVTASLNGSIDLVGQSVDLRLDATQAGSTAEASGPPPRLTLAIEGPWSSPALRAQGGPPEADRASPPPQ